MPPRLVRRASGLVCCVAAAAALSSCRRQEAAAPPVATPTVTLSHEQAPLGSPVDITYKFVVASGARIDQDYRVMVHVIDVDDQMIFAFDHQPPVPTSQWKPGQTIEYTRTEFIPIYPYVGQATIQVGLYSPANQKRLALVGQDAGQHAYTVAHLELQPQTENLATTYGDGWNSEEIAEHNASVSWRWTKKDATLSFKNPKKNCVLYLDVDNPADVFHETQQVQVSAGGQVVGGFALAPREEKVMKIPIAAEQLGSEDTAELHIAVDKTFVPALLPASNDKDSRELGVRVFHAFIDPR